MADWRMVLVLIAALDAPFGPANQASSGSNKHTGAIVDATNGKALRGAYAIAYARRAPQAVNSVCPEHEGLIDRQKVNNSGQFELTVPTVNYVFLTVYCSALYAAREVDANDNRSGRAIEPEPVILYPTREKLRRDRIKEITAARQAITFVLNDTEHTLMQLREADPSTFAMELQALPNRERDIVRAFGDRETPDRRPQPDSNAVQRPVRNVIGAATSNLQYVDTSAGVGPYDEASATLSATDRALAAQLWTRPDPSVAPTAPTDLRIIASRK